jgi:hypothetical protein
MVRLSLFVVSGLPARAGREHDAVAVSFGLGGEG